MGMAVNSLCRSGNFVNTLLHSPRMANPRLYLSGISDEAGHPIERQIEAHRQLGWTNLDLRLVPDVDGKSKNLTLVQDEVFAGVAEAVKAAGMSVPCFASSVANWNRPITGDLNVDIAELTSAALRMKQFGTHFIRVMSWERSADLDDIATRDEVIRRMKVLAELAETEDITLLHENCAGWAGESVDNSLRLVHEVASPNFALLYDTGNPIQYLQNPWEMFTGTLAFTRMIHIKDCRSTGTKHGEVYTFAGEGDGMVEETLKELFRRNYQGGLVIEPHLAAVIHTGETAGPEQLFSSYTEYGRRLTQLVLSLLSGNTLYREAELSLREKP